MNNECGLTAMGRFFVVVILILTSPLRGAGYELDAREVIIECRDGSFISNERILRCFKYFGDLIDVHGGIQESLKEFSLNGKPIHRKVQFKKDSTMMVSICGGVFYLNCSKSMFRLVIDIICNENLERNAALLERYSIDEMGHFFKLIKYLQLRSPFVEDLRPLLNRFFEKPIIRKFFLEGHSGLREIFTDLEKAHTDFQILVTAKGKKELRKESLASGFSESDSEGSRRGSFSLEQQYLTECLDHSPELNHQHASQRLLGIFKKAQVAQRATVGIAPEIHSLLQSLPEDVRGKYEVLCKTESFV